MLDRVYLFLTKLNNNYDTFNEHDNIQCYKGKHRSLEDIANICKTYYNTNPDEVKQILLNFGDNLVGHYCNTIHKRVYEHKHLYYYWTQENSGKNDEFGLPILYEEVDINKITLIKSTKINYKND